MHFWKMQAPCVWAVVALCSLSMFAQNRQQKPVSQSELARQNMAHVAANTEQLGLILHRDPGLMVEVKRWIAKDATDHGQIITETDLAEEAIFDRLENDVTFRAVVTEIVQKYGYLQPQVNPDSPLAKQQELLIQERVKWITEEEAADREKMKAAQEKLAEQQNCDPRTANCGAQNAATPPIQGATTATTAWNYQSVSATDTRIGASDRRASYGALCAAATSNARQWRHRPAPHQRSRGRPGAGAARTIERI